MWLLATWSCGGPRRPEKPPAPLPETTQGWSVDEPALEALGRRLLPVLQANRRGFQGVTGRVEGFGAGDAYPQVWLRDSATLVPVARYYYPREVLVSWLDEHLAHQQDSGSLYDWIAPGAPEEFPYAPRARVVHEGGGTILSADTNTTEADQESSAVLAAARIYDAVAQPAFLRHAVAGRAWLDRLDAALEYRFRDGRDPRTGLLTSALTADWGDVSPVYPDQRAIYLDEHTPVVAGLYTNAQFVGAARALARLHAAAGDDAGRAKWSERAERVRVALEASLWREDQGFYRIHADVADRGFAHDDDGIFAFGGHAVAVVHSLLGPDRLGRVLAVAEQRHRDAGLATLAGSLLPPYPAGTFAHPILSEPYTYQNGGQWDWFSGRFLLALFQAGHAGVARDRLVEIARRVEAAGGLWEWYTLHGEGRGSARYAGSAGALGRAVVEGLFGVELDAAGLRLWVRLGSHSGSIDLHEPGTGRRVRYGASFVDPPGRMLVHWDADPPPSSIGVLLPPGRGAEWGLVNGHAAPVSTREVGDDRYAVLTNPPGQGRLEISLQPLP